MAGTTLPPAPGDVRGRQMGNYEVICRLSAGGMAEIFLASRKGLAGFQKPVVLKKILPDIQGQEEFVQMFLDEARVTAAFNHPNIAQVFDLDVDRDELFLAMEFVPGATLLEIARVCGAAKEPIPIGLSLATVRDTALALHYAHTYTDPLGEPSPVIHRDVAEKNIMVTYEGVTKLLDFGIAKSMAAVSRTQVGMVKGTSGYMSPEQILGEPLDARSDLFSLGVVLHECLTGMRLFPGKQPAAVVNAVLRAPIPEPSRLNKNVPPELDAIVLKVLSRKRGDRYATALEFARALERAVGPLIWLPEQSGELLRRLFAERREQTRQQLASVRSATGELKLSLPAVEREAAPPPRTPTPPPARPPPPAPPPFGEERPDPSDATELNLSTYKVLGRPPVPPSAPAEARGVTSPPPPPTEPIPSPARTRTASETPRAPRPGIPPEPVRAGPPTAPEPPTVRARSVSRAELPAPGARPEEEEVAERDIKTAIIRPPRTITSEQAASAPPPARPAPVPPPAPPRPARRPTVSSLEAATQPSGTPMLTARPPVAPVRASPDDEGPDYVTTPVLLPPPPLTFEDDEEGPAFRTDQVKLPEEITVSNPAVRPSPPARSRARGWVLAGLLLLGGALVAGTWMLLRERPPVPRPPPSVVPASPAPPPPSPPTPPPASTGPAPQAADPEPTKSASPTDAPATDIPAADAPATEVPSPTSPKRPKTPPVRNRREPAPSPSTAAAPGTPPAPSPSAPSEPAAAAPPAAPVAAPVAAAPVVSSADPEQIWHVLERSRAGKLEPTDSTGLLTLTTDQYAQVYLGSHLVGETPLFNVTVPTGHYVLKVVGPEGQPVKLTVDVKAGEVTKKRVSFENPTP